ncbi:hypothetical protein OIU84_003066 [Salix udensis]|uniref:Uncharacterized protein n=1 Tax=Salix udensis TaxID=889485 RepID=A0AAD6K5F5_9ROSI|nr:hypothetical protein OIU84_003066 [Salix udensis]
MSSPKSTGAWDRTNLHIYINVVHVFAESSTSKNDSSTKNEITITLLEPR